MGPRTFPKRLRIRTSRQYREHRRRSRTFRTRSFIVAWAPGDEDDSRLGTVVSRKVGGAVVRNRIKRCLREWFRLHRHELTASWDLVVIARPHAAGMDLRRVEEEFTDLVRWLDKKTRGKETSRP